MTETTLPAAAQVDETGKIAIKYRQPAPAQLKIGGELRYITHLRANISLTWVAPEHLDEALTKRDGCNCGGRKKQQSFLLANENDVRQWTNGGGR